MQTNAPLITPYGTTPGGQQALLYTLTNAHGLRARVTNFGAILVSLEAPDRNGQLADLTHGFDSLAGWQANPHYFGASIGRFGNRIRNGQFSLDGKSYQLATNNAPAGIPCHLHGGISGFNKALWLTTATSPNSATFQLVSPDGDEGYPGNLTAKITYTLTDHNELIWQAHATTDAPTIINLVHHSYWNLSGNPHSLITDHLLMIAADHYLPTNPGLIPTGELKPVHGTPMDFTHPTPIGDRLHDPCEDLRIGNGYDHCWVLPKTTGIRTAATVLDPKSGRKLTILTDQPGIQFYDASFLDGTTEGKNGTHYTSRSALCLETQNFPDSPNQPSFPSPVLRPGEHYHHTLIHQFTTV